ncbi:hypothetical protein EPO34_04425 [Patescibacteria group bacterium]|nr:MAG: hypothetical protein EPO34_04425 [Patescibacteria group bacterium]
MPFAVSLEKFSGPLQLLLEIIEREELPITEVSLAKVADDYLRYVNATDVPAEELADFLMVATKLLLLKSKAILPQLAVEEEVDGNALALQLKMYKEFADASKGIEALWNAPANMFARERAKAVAVASFSPPEGISPQTLADAFHVMLKRLEPFFALRQTAMERVVSVQERIRDIHRAILERARLTFREVSAGAASKVDVVVSFLALLELVKQRVVRVAQSDSFADITIARAD